MGSVILKVERHGNVLWIHSNIHILTRGIASGLPHGICSYKKWHLKARGLGKDVISFLYKEFASSHGTLSLIFLSSPSPPLRISLTICWVQVVPAFGKVTIQTPERSRDKLMLAACFFLRPLV